ncbi:MAG: hypothetical protein KME08_15535 [Aphanothece sp. CMT-3BRIN-NPC111]|jgi:hypothetical protein|nr:hypothetical protein [Aphanothece sp. CMT-3BRIN-NPC111]
MHFVRRYAVIVPMAVVISFLSVSCGESKVSQCKKLINTANQTVKEANEVTNGGQTRNPDTMLKAADNMDKAAKEMEALKVSDERLKEYQAGYIKMYRDTSTATRDLVGAFKKKERQAVNVALKNLQQAIVPEPQLVSGVNKYCNNK